MFSGGSSRWTLSALSSTCVRRLCGELSRRPARIIYDCRAARNGTTLIEHCCMLIFLAGVSCVGKTMSFFRLGYRNRAFLRDVDRAPSKPSPDVTRFPARGVTSLETRAFSGVPPSGLLGGYWKVVNERRDATIVVLRDTAENILKRITFYDIDSRPLHECLTDRERASACGK